MEGGAVLRQIERKVFFSVEFLLGILPGRTTWGKKGKRRKSRGISKTGANNGHGRNDDSVLALGQEGGEEGRERSTKEKEGEEVRRAESRSCRVRFLQ